MHNYGSQQRTKRRSYIQSETIQNLKNEIDTLKIQLSERDEIHIYYDHIMKLASATSNTAFGGNGDEPLIKPKKHYNKFINQAMQQQLVKTEYADIELEIKLTDNQILNIKSHRYLLATCSPFMEALLRRENTKQQQQRDGNGGGGSGGMMTVSLDLSDWCDSREVARVFFVLFYANVFEDTHFSVDEIAFIITNACTLYEMATRFQFKPLLHYTKLKIFESFSMESFPVLFQYCVAYYNVVSPPPTDNNAYMITTTTTTRRCKVLTDKVSIFKRLISWFICCANIHAYHLPYLNLMESYSCDSVTTENNNQDGDAIVIDQQQQPTRGLGQLRWSLNTSQDSVMKKKRRRLSTHNDRKVDLYDMMCQSVDSFEKYDHVSRFISYDDKSRSTTMRSFDRVCLACVHNNNRQHFCCLNMCMDKETGFTRRWQFYIQFSDKNHSNIGGGGGTSTLYGKVNYLMKENMWITGQQSGRNNSTANMFIGGSVPRLACHTTVSSLSRLYKNDETTSGPLPTTSSFESFTPLLNFQLPPESSCYTGECDVCAAKDVRIFAIKYQIIAKDSSV